MKKGLVSLCILGALGFLGCSPCDTYHSTYEGHSVEFYNFKKSKNNANYLYFYSKEKNSGNVNFRDLDQDGRFDRINLSDIKKGDEVEQYANLKTGQKIVNSITNKK